MGKIKQLIEDHPNIWEFIKFNVLSNCATITNFIIMWLCTGLFSKALQIHHLSFWCSITQIISSPILVYVDF